jgi:hypothetical protein
VEGPIQGGEVVLKSLAHVVGDIHHQSLIIEKGAYFDGRAAQVHGANGRQPDITTKRTLRESWEADVGFGFWCSRSSPAQLVLHEASSRTPTAWARPRVKTSNDNSDCDRDDAYDNRPLCTRACDFGSGGVFP